MIEKHDFTPRRALVVGLSLAAAALVAPGSAAASDGNDDSIPDSWEQGHGLSLNKDQAKRDQDRDGLRNRGEFRFRMDPRDDDSDDDGVEDGDEGAGTIASFDAATGRLVINTLGGDTASGLVTDDTEIECDHEDGEDEHGDDETAITDPETTTAVPVAATLETTTPAAPEETTKATSRTARPPTSWPARWSRRPSSSSRTARPPGTK